MSIFVRWHNVEVFNVPISWWMFLYMLIPSRCTYTIKCVGVYPMPTPWLRVYYARWAKEVRDVQQLTYDHIAMRHFNLLGVPGLLGAARWGIFAVDSRDRRLTRDGYICKAVIGSVSGLIRWTIGGGDPLQILQDVARMANAERNLFVFETILEVDWALHIGGFIGRDRVVPVLRIRDRSCRQVAGVWYVFGHFSAV